MLSGSRDVVSVSPCVSLCEHIGVLAEAAPDTQAFFFPERCMCGFGACFFFLRLREIYESPRENLERPEGKECSCASRCDTPGEMLDDFKVGLFCCVLPL